MHAYVCMHVCAHACMRACVRACVHVCTYVYMDMRTQSEIMYKAVWPIQILVQHNISVRIPTVSLLCRHMLRVVVHNM